MAKFKKALALVLSVCLICAIGVFSVNAATVSDDDIAEVSDSSGITVHYYSENGTPNIYYWNSLPQNIETDYPGPQMTPEGDDYYTYTFNNVTKINLMFVTNGEQSAELTRNTGEWWYKNGRWYSHDPSDLDDWSRTDMREDSIYFVITTRFYDGDTGNNVHCWDDSTANNPDSDPAWRGDFKGLIEKLDYIKALGFSAIWITPVVTNASGYDYHGYHAFDFSTVDVRYESSDATFQDLIDAVHEKGMKIIQDVVWNHTGNFGEATLAPMFTKEYDTIEDLASVDCMVPIADSDFANTFPNYSSLDANSQYDARLNIMKDTGKLDSGSHDTDNYYHHESSLSWGSYTEQAGQIAGDCVDVNTENPVVADYINESYLEYAEMGVDAFRLDTEKHISRWTLNSAYFSNYTSLDNFYIFGEVCARTHELVNEGGLSDTPFFYTWAETDSPWTSNWSTTDWSANYSNFVKHYSAYQTNSISLTSDNAFLKGITYHTPDYSQANGTGVIDFRMHWSFSNASEAYRAAKEEDQYFNDSTWNVVYVDSHDYGPDTDNRYSGGTQSWAENMDLMFTFRGIPCIYYGTEVEFQAGAEADKGTDGPLSTTGRAYFGDYIEGTVTTTDFSKYTNATGTVASTLASPLSVHLQQLNAIRRAVPALQKGQYTVSSTYVSSGNMAFVRRYTDGDTDSLACVTISGGATFKNLPNGTYIDAVTGDVKEVTNGTLTVSSIGTANMRVYVCCADGFTGISGKIGTNGTYLK